MRRVIWMMSVSLDGFMEDTDHSLEWQLVDEELHWHFNRELETMSAFLDGRITYELMAGFWPTADHDPDASPPMAEFARIWREMPKIVYSRTLTEAAWDTTIVREVVPAEVAALKALPGGDLMLGGGDLGSEFMRLGLVDELRVYIHPIVLGRGKPMFAPLTHPVGMHLEENRTFSSGVVLLRYVTGVTSSP